MLEAPPEVHFVAQAVTTLGGVWALLYWSKKRQQGGTADVLNIVRYAGYSLVGAGIGVLLAAWLVLDQVTNLPPVGIVLGLVVIGIACGFWAANRFPNSLR